MVRKEGRREEGRQINREGREGGKERENEEGREKGREELKHFKKPPNSNSKDRTDKK